MRRTLVQEIKSVFPQVKKNVPIAPLTTFGIGGRARFYLPVETEADFLTALNKAVGNRLPFLVMAGGSNVIFPDTDIQKLIIHYQTVGPAGRLAKVSGSPRAIYCPAGFSLARLIKTSTDRGLAGLETLSGIPGTVGGAIVGNAGAYGHEIGEVIESVKIFDGQKIRWLSGRGCRFHYRDSLFKHRPLWVLGAVFKFKKGRPVELKKISRDIIRLRRKKYKPDLRCPGSFFKNILVSEMSKKKLAKIDSAKIIAGKIPAGYLLEMIGARGRRPGGIYIADFHGNLLINDGHGTYREVRKLAALLKRQVKNRFGLVLEEEIRYLN